MQASTFIHEPLWIKWCHLTLSNNFLPNWNFESKRKMSAKMPTTSTEKTDLKTTYDWTWAGRSFSCSKKYLCERNITDLSEPGNGTHHPPTCSFLNRYLKYHHKLSKSMYVLSMLQSPLLTYQLTLLYNILILLAWNKNMYKQNIL